LSLLAGVAACGFALTSQTPPKACSSDAECATNEVCLDVGCAVPETHLVFQVVPPAAISAELPTQDFADVNVDGPVSLQLGPPGTLTVSSDVYPITLSFTGAALNLPGLALLVPPVTLNADQRVALPTGTYRVQATPTGTALPPRSLDVSVAEPGQVIDAPLRFLTPQDFPRIDGVLRGPVGLAADTPLSYAIQAFHADGTPASQPAVAGLGRDGGALGYGPSLGFSLLVAPSSAGESLRLTASPSAGVGPTVSFSGSLTSLQAQSSADDGGLWLGTAVAHVALGKVVDPAGHAVAGAQVQLSASLAGQARYTSERVTTDDGGSYRATCLHDDAATPGESYQVLVIPPAPSHLAVTQAMVAPTWHASAASDFGTVTLASLTTASGRVLDASGNPVSNATVQVTPARDNTLPLTQGSATTDANGQYQVSLSPGLYHFDYTPPLTLQAPSASRGPLQVSGARTALADVAFSSARMAQGTVTDADGKPVAGALIRVYYVAATPSGSNDDATARPTLLASALSLTDGSFSVVLPAPSAHAP